MTYTLRINSGLGWGGYRATLYGPGLPVVEPARDMNVVSLDLRRIMREVRKMGPVPKHVFGWPEETDT